MGQSRWAEIRSRTLSDPAMRQRYERTRRSVAAVRQVLQTIDAARERVGMTKAELAERAGTNPAAMRRLLTSGSSNPTLRTLIEVSDALGLEMVVRPKHHDAPRVRQER